MSDEKREHEETLRKIEARKVAFQKSPAWFTIWDIMRTILKVIFWLAFWSLVAQCSCDCIW